MRGETTIYQLVLEDLRSLISFYYNVRTYAEAKYSNEHAF